MDNKIQKWVKMGHDEPWQPMYDDVTYSLPETNVQFYWTPAGKHNRKDEEEYLRELKKKL